MSEKSIVIVGAGVIGLSTAYYCARRGHRVTVIDRHPAERDGCSYGNAGMVVPSHFIPLAAPGMVALGLKWMWNPESPFYIKPRLNPELLRWMFQFWRAANPRHVQQSAPLLRDLSFASRACFEELAQWQASDFGLVRKGLIMLCGTEHTLEEEAKFAARANELGVPAEVLDPTGVAKLDPEIQMTVAGGVYFPQDCHLTPQRFMASLQSECQRLGVNFIWNADIRRLTGQSGGQVEPLQTASGEITFDELVLCGGSWSSELARQLGLKIPMQAGKGYSLTLPSPPERPALCAILCEARVAVTPMGTSLRFGGTMEIAGLNEDINPVRVRGIINSVSRYYPNFSPRDFAGIPAWRGLRPCSPDGLPYLGRTRRFRNLSVATGHAMMGLSLGPITGKLMSEVLSGEKPSHNLQLLDPDRYA
jgi:D-amino-acid dehydrogenase